MTVIGLVWSGPVGNAEIIESNKFLPEGITIKYSQTDSDVAVPAPITRNRLLEMAISPDIVEAARIFSGPEISAIGYACTSASYVRGMGGDVEISMNITSTTGLPSTTTSTSIVNALNHLGSRRISVLSPHVDELNNRLRIFLEEYGFEVIHMRGLNKLRGIEEISSTDISELVEHLVDSQDADSIVVSCTGMKTAEIIDQLENKIGKPVIPALTATIWECLRLAGIEPNIKGKGMLMSQIV